MSLSSFSPPCGLLVVVLILLIGTVHSFSASTTTSTSSSSMSSNNAKPKLPLPLPICSDIPGTWAYDTMSRRVNEEILERTIQDMKEDNEYWKDKPEFATIQSNIQSLRDELSNAATTELTMLDEPQDDDPSHRQKEYDEWKMLLEPFLQNHDTWLTAPWMVTEFYVYRRFMQAIQYWDPQSSGYMYDPFLAQKRAGLSTSLGSAENALGKILQLVAADDDGSKTTTTTTTIHDGLAIAASLALWGNKMDLSLWPANVDQDAHVDVFSDILHAATENLLHDDTPLLISYCEEKLLRKKGGGNVDIIVDNAGFELVTDLALAQYLIQSKIAKVVTFQLKSHPTFVSDALEKDLRETVDYYANADASQYPNCVAAGTIWKEFLGQGKWQCHEDDFWVQPFAMWDMTEPLRTDMSSRCDLAFVKGDANYRRLLGDLQWEYTASFQDIVGVSFPCPVCALRTLKAELGCGMDAEQVERAAALDDNWMTNGRFGVVQLGTGAAVAAAAAEAEKTS